MIGVIARAHEMDVKGKKVQLRIRDTAGMERFKAITSQYYHNAQGIIVVYDVANRESFDALSRWFRELDTYVSPAVVNIIVGNKVDSSRQVFESEGQEFAKRMNPLFIEASAKTAVGVEAAFRNLVERILHTPELLQSNAGPKSVNVSMEPDEAQTQSEGCC
ncbi:ras family-domain-containing protein [Fomes fomentarius]|nr:ras family-domain-containing protein [Fomes fomentarius]